MINQVALTGNLAREVELRQTTNGVPYARFVIAVTRTHPNKNGEREADFIDCVAWRQTGEAMHKYFRKGSRVGVTGRISTGSYDDAQGQHVYRTNVIVEDFYFLEKREETEARPQNPGQSATYTAATTQSTDPYNSPDPFASAGKRVDISDDDLPF